MLAFQMLDLLAAYRTALGHRYRSDVLAVAFRAMQPGNQIDRQSTLIAAELAGDTFEIDLLIKSAFETEGMDGEAGVHHRAERRMSCGIEFLGQLELSRAWPDYRDPICGVKSMLKSPLFPARHPDRHVDCQEILEDRIITIVDEARAAGWSVEEIAVALVELALGHRANLNLEAALGAARDNGWRWTFN